MDLWRKIKPKNLFDSISMIYGQAVLHLLIGDLYILPWYTTEPEDISWFKISILYVYITLIYMNILGSFWKMWMVNSSVIGVMLPSTLKEDWYYCPACECNCPPRTFHCPTCNRCILKRDHHCSFAGKCVGYNTYRHFIYLVFYACLGCWTVVFMRFELTWTVLGGFSKWNLLYFLLPIPCFVTGQISFNKLSAAFLLETAGLFAISLTLLLIYHSKHILHGLTTYERRHGIYTYDLSYKQNFLNVFGYRWHVAWLFPTIESPLPIDGIEHVKRHKYENPKDV